MGPPLTGNSFLFRLLMCLIITVFSLKYIHCFLILRCDRLFYLFTIFHASSPLPCFLTLLTLDLVWPVECEQMRSMLGPSRKLQWPCVAWLCPSTLLSTKSIVLHAIESAPTPSDSMNEWCPQCPSLNTPAQLFETHANNFFYGVSPFHMWSSSFPAAFYFPQHYCFFQKILPSHDVPEVEQLKRTAVIFIARIHWILECSKEFQKKAGLCFIDNRTVKPLTTLNMRSSGLLWEKWVCLSTRLSCCTPCTEKRKSLSGQNAERRNGFP